jgi:hypothetical protein
MISSRSAALHRSAVIPSRRIQLLYETMHAGIVEPLRRHLCFRVTAQPR